MSTKELLEQEKEEIQTIEVTLGKLKHLRRGLWDKGTSNEEEVVRLLDIDRQIDENEKRKKKKKLYFWNCFAFFCCLLFFSFLKFFDFDIFFVS